MWFIDRQLNYGRHLIRKFVFASLPFQSALDIGAGHGADLEIVRSFHPQAKLFAVEAYPPYAAELRARNIIVYPLDIERECLPFDDCQLDVVIANQVLEHTKEVFWIVHEISRVLRVGGKFILGIPNLASLHNRLLLLVGRQPTVITTASAHVRGFTKNDVQRFFEACFPGGYALKSYGGSNFYPFSPFIARPLARVFPDMAWGLFFLFEKVRAYSGEFLELPKREKLETNFYLGDSHGASAASG